MGFRELEAWKSSRAFVATIYRITVKFPASEQFGLTNQTRRAAVSIPANIAEGYGRKSRGAYVQFLRIAKGSLNELETLLLLASDLGYVEDIAELEREIGRLGTMLTNLIGKIELNAVHEEVAEYMASPDYRTPELPNEN